MKLVYPACFYPCNEMPGYTVVIPDFPGCVTQGNSLADAITMAIDAASGWALDALEDGETLPQPSSPKKMVLEYDDGFINLIVLDMDTYAEKYGNRAIRKNLTIPAWLNTIAEKKNINFSAVLQEALVERLHVGK